MLLDVIIHVMHKENHSRASDILSTYSINSKVDILGLVFRPFQKFTGTFRPKRDNKTKGYKKGVSIKRYKTETFNPNSRDMIADRLQSIKGWKPKNFTATGNRHGAFIRGAQHSGE